MKISILGAAGFLGRRVAARLAQQGRLGEHPLTALTLFDLTAPPKPETAIPVTAIAGDPQTNLDFYAGVLGLRLVKLTVNFDDPGTYHLYYGDGVGRPGWIRAVGRDDLTMSFTTEEHGVGTIDIEQGGRLEIGDKIEFIPSHICPVVNLFDSVFVTRDGDVIDEYRVASRGKVR